MNRVRPLIVSVAMAALALALPAPAAMAHGVDLTAGTVEGVEVTAVFDGGGGPMAGAQVTVFAPDDPARPWMTGTTDEEGRFFFVPDAALPGTWDVQVRQAGHGGIVRVEVTAEGAEVAADAAGLPVTQKALMALAVAWGALGTALYFRRRAA